MWWIKQDCSLIIEFPFNCSVLGHIRRQLVSLESCERVLRNFCWPEWKKFDFLIQWEQYLEVFGIILEKGRIYHADILNGQNNYSLDENYSQCAVLSSIQEIGLVNEISSEELNCYDLNSEPPPWIRQECARGKEQEKVHGLVRNKEQHLQFLRHQKTDIMKQGSDDTQQKQQEQHHQEPVQKKKPFKRENANALSESTKKWTRSLYFLWGTSTIINQCD